MIAAPPIKSQKSKLILELLLDLKSVRLNHEYLGKIITQKEIANHLSITVSTFQKYEKSYYQEINLNLLIKTLKFFETKNLNISFQGKPLYQTLLELSFDLPLLRKSATEKITQKTIANHLKITLSTFQRYEKNYYQITPITSFIKILEFYENKNVKF